MKIYHNPMCSKSRQTLALLTEFNQKFEIVDYLKTPPSEKELSKIIKLLKIKPIDLVRKNEAIWKESFKNKKLSDKEIIKIMVQNPRLIERPIVVKDNKATIGRPPENIKEIL